MRVSAVLALVFVAVASASTLPGAPAHELDARLAEAQKLDKRCICSCNESSCSGPPCCASGTCGGGNSDYC
ncbi:hypothetical protein ACRE_091230 [Hapsidospora chrysogenum ATCC 11550]|uniref:Uncharacterized protein n=1 Tax=Hapsidospora chrysogenum (strain ATCC 11550 / CBS 779.69 / DSM 880 / IAM 14645 / JCM 23072 / IMI 49137) TaxID=857340 RepID=A0A086SSY8_HAPC1|nr:hypothetical protein ACRE_091230 [Hapsidospora chrysogenum ATCC 11550]